MRRKAREPKASAEKVVKDIRRATRRRYNAEERVRIVLEGLRGEDSIAALCRREGINQNLYYRWSKEFLEAGKKRLAGDAAREATSDEVKDLRREALTLKEVVAELTLENRLLKKARSEMGARRHEVSRIGEAGDHPARRTGPSAGPPNGWWHFTITEAPPSNGSRKAKTSSSGRGCRAGSSATTRSGCSFTPLPTISVTS